MDFEPKEKDDFFCGDLRGDAALLTSSRMDVTISNFSYAAEIS